METNNTNDFVQIVRENERLKLALRLINIECKQASLGVLRMKISGIVKNVLEKK